MYAGTKKLTGWYLGVGMTALFIGGALGPLQKLEHVGINVYPALTNVGLNSYYQGLTIHGVLNVLVWTTFFIVGFLTFANVHSLKRDLTHPKLNWASLIIMIVGLVMAAVPVLLNLATVLFTFYPPLQASPYYYIGLTLVVIGSWVGGWGMFLTYRCLAQREPRRSDTR
jgi:cytochrome c oxidase subunit 1